MSKVYEVINERIISLLEQGTVPWHKPWRGAEGAPKNLVSDKPYRGINTFMLATTGYGSPYWATFKQAKDRGGTVKKGEKGYPCVFWNWQEKKDEDSGEVKKVPFTRYYTVFNVEQCEGLDYPEAPKPDPWFHPIERCELVEGCMPNPPNRDNKERRAFYRPSTDTIHMPLPDLFDSAEDYYATLFHEMVHSTGHESRLARKGIVEDIVFGCNTYSKEELIAEMGATYLCAETFIDNKVMDNSVSYIAGWISRLKNDKRLLVQAGGQAQKAVDYIFTRDDSAES